GRLMLRDIIFHLQTIFARPNMERELDDELRFHLEHQIALYESAGQSHEEAERRARLEFGGLEQVKENARDARGIWIIETVVRDLGYGARVLGGSPGCTLMGLLSLGLGF